MGWFPFVRAFVGLMFLPWVYFVISSTQLTNGTLTPDFSALFWLLCVPLLAAGVGVEWLERFLSRGEEDDWDAPPTTAHNDP